VENSSMGISHTLMPGACPPGIHDFAFNYYNTDHLGNVREVVSAAGTVQQVTNYYPFGATYFDDSAVKASDYQPYKYNGKELDRMHGLDTYDYGARQYNPILARWDRMDPLCESYYPYSPYNYCLNNPVKHIDPDGNSPLSSLLKQVAKQGVKAGIKSYVKKNIEHRLKNYMSDKMLKQFAKDVDDVMGTLDNTWWETAIELVPVAGDIYGSTKFVKQVKKAYDKLQDLENKYVGEIYKSLPKGQRDKFVKNMRSKGVVDARKDQAKGLDVGGDVKYKKRQKIDGHHRKKVSKNPDKMTDPRNIEFMEQSDHIKYHQQNGY
jgi:RHS repeat-associated protein